MLKKSSMPGNNINKSYLLSVVALCGSFVGSLLAAGCSPALLSTTTQKATVATANHGGWTEIQALGARTPVAQATGLSTVAASVTLSWADMSYTSGTEVSPALSYKIYRSTSSGGQDFGTPLAEGITTAARTYTDSTVVSGNTYYYVVRPVVAVLGTMPVAEVDGEVKVIVPPENMVLMHRWMVNKEICGLMSRSVDRSNNYRCSYTGPTSSGGYYDLGRSLLLDMFEGGCNFTPAPGCGDAVHGCVGIGIPGAGVGNDGDVFIDRGSSICYYKSAGAWKANSDVTLTSAERAIMISNKPGLPPMSFTSQARAWDSCASQTAPGFGTKRLLRRSEQFAAMAWPSSLSNTDIDNIVTGTNMPVTGYCNVNNGNGMGWDNLQTPADIETLPCTFASTCQLVRTGSIATRNCKTRYGAQDMIGNNHEWVSDEVSTCSAATHSCSLVTSTLDTSNTDFNGINFDGTAFPGGGGANVTSWAYTAMSFSATRFLVPLGLPMVTSAAASYDSTAIGAGAGEFDPANFRSNTFSIFTDNANGVPARGIFAGGSFNLGAGSGRYTVSLRNVPTASGMNTGFRCIAEGN
jgi:hypothetical protein